MTHQDNLAAVRAACVAANPEIADREKYRHECAMCHEVEEYEPEIGLGDVLLALGEDYAVRGDGSLWELEKYEDAPDTFLCQIDLRLPLSGWSEETVAYLANLLK